MFHRDPSRSGFTQDELQGPLHLRWVLQTGGRVFFASPTLYRDRCYCGSRDGYLYAVEAGTGSFLWRFRTGDEGNLSNSVGAELIFAGSNRDGCLWAISTEKGEQIWTYQTLGPVFATP